MARELVVRIIGDASSYEKALATSARGTSKFNREIGRSFRGAAAGSGVFRGLGRSIAFASGGFLAFAGGARFLEQSIGAARDAAVAHRALAAQMKASGERFNDYRGQIEKATLSGGKFGFQNDEVVASLTVLERGTGKMNQALHLQGLAYDLARAKGGDLSAAAQTVAKVFGGQETALRRAVPGLAKTAHGWNLIREAQEKLAGQAAAGTTSAERFQAVLHDTQELIGTALLPDLNKYLDSMSKWLSNTKNQHELAKQLNNVLGATTAVIGGVSGAFKDLNKVTGSTKHSLELLLGAFVAFKTLRVVSSLAEIAGNIGLIGSRAATARGQVGGFIGALGGPRAAAGGAAGGAALALSEQGEQLTFRGKRPPAFLVAGMTPLGAGWYLSGSHYLRWNPASGKFDRDQTSLPSILGRRPPGALGPARHVAGPARGTMAAAVPAAVPAGPSAATLSRIFDTQIGRLISRSAYDTQPKQLRDMQVIAHLLEQRLKVTKDVTRRLDLIDKLMEVQYQARQIRTQIAADKLAATQERAQKALERAQARALVRETRQFRALGFGPGGQPLVPGSGDLLNSLKLIRRRLAGSSLDTAKRRTLLDTIFSELTDPKKWGKLSADVRSQIQTLLSGIDQQLKQHRDKAGQTGFVHTSAAGVLAGLGLSAAQRRALSIRLAGVGPGGSVPSASGQFAGAGGITVHNLNLHGVRNVEQLEQQLMKRSKQRVHTRRAPR